MSDVPNAHEHVPFPDPNHSVAAFIGNAILGYKDGLERLHRAMAEGHPDPLSVEIGRCCDCCGTSVDIGSYLDVEKSHLEAAWQFIPSDDLDVLRDYHETLILFASGDRSEEVAVSLRVLRRELMVVGWSLFFRCSSVFCPACREQHARRIAMVEESYPKWPGSSEDVDIELLRPPLDGDNDRCDRGLQPGSLPNSSLADDRSMTAKQVGEAFDKSESWVRTQVKENPDFPRPYKYKGKHVWSRSEVYAYREKLAAKMTR